MQARRDADIAAIASRNLTEGHPIDGVFVIAVVTKAARNVGSLPYIIGAVTEAENIDTCSPLGIKQIGYAEPSGYAPEFAETCQVKTRSISKWSGASLMGLSGAEMLYVGG